MVYLIVFSLLLLIYLIISFVVFYVACHKGTLKQIDEGVKKASEPYKDIIKKANEYYRDLPKEDVFLESFDHLTIHAKFIKHDKAVGTIVLLHGYKSTAEKDLVPALENYRKLKLNILLVDNRTVNMSEGKYTTFGILESKDAIKWVKYAKKTYKLPVILGGISMGATSALLAAPYVNKDIVCVISDSPFADGYKQIEYVVNHYSFLWGKPFMPCVNLFAKIIGKFNLKTSIYTNLNKIKNPILFIHGDSDTFVPCQNTLDLYSNFTGTKEILIGKDTDHGMTFYTDNKHYVKIIKDFIKLYIK